MSGFKRFHAPTIHIKTHTKGTSNELSLSVLDAAKQSQRTEASEPTQVGGVDVFTLPGRRAKPKGAPKKNESLLYQSDAVVNRKRAKRTWTSKAQVVDNQSSSGIFGATQKNKLPWFRVVLGVLALALVALVVGISGTYFQSETTKQDYYQEQLDQAITAVSETDVAFDALQVLVNDLFGEHFEEDTIIAEQRARVSELLTSADQKARLASKNLTNKKNQQAAGNVVLSISSRITLWNTGLALIDETAAVKAAKTHMEAGWQSALEGDSALKNAANEILVATENALEETQTLTYKAQAAFQEALTQFMEVQNIYPAYDVSAYVAYTKKRLEACDHAVASNQALLDHDLEQANEQNTAYNKTDTEAVLLADSLPRDPLEAINEVFEDNTQQNKKLYETTRTQLENTDAFIRDYLGADKK